MSHQIRSFYYFTRYTIGHIAQKYWIQSMYKVPGSILNISNEKDLRKAGPRLITFT